MRAREPDQEGYVERGGIKVGYEVFGTEEPAVLLLPAWSIVPSRIWKAQVPYLARHARVITFDPRGNGRSDHPRAAEAYAAEEFVADALDVLDATGTRQAVLVSLSRGNEYALRLAADHPGRVLGWVALGPYIFGLGDGSTAREEVRRWFDRDLGVDEGWKRYNRYSWLRDQRGFAEFFFGELLPEPHSTKQVEDAVSWAMDIEPETLVATEQATIASSPDAVELAPRVQCPVLVVHGTDDRAVPLAQGQRLAELTGGNIVAVPDAGHLVQVRHPVLVNHLLRDFVDAVAGRIRPPTPSFALRRPRRVLYLSSPIGLGHVRRDLAIADALRKERPEVEVEWLTQSPVTDFLEQRGEKVHPASSYLASESTHIESESGEHDLHAFQAIRRMDEVLVANFMVFDDLVSRESFDLWVGDEAWDLDHFLHENPELKRAPFVWMTDFVGWMPMVDGGEREAFLSADYNAEMVEHVARFPSLRDLSVFVGDPADVVDLPLGPNLPNVREWTKEHFEFAGYVMGQRPDPLERTALRARLGYADSDVVCLVSVGGSGVGTHLLRRVVASYDEARRRIPNLRMVVVTGPRIDPASIAAPAGVEVHGFLPDLDLHHAACDIAVVQGGLSTTMELTASGRPFLYFPLGHHFEQQVHVRHRLERHGAGRCMDYRGADPSRIAGALVEELGRPLSYVPVPTDGASRAAQLVAELI